MKTHCSVPAKLILSGEHAVVYQCPALSMAIDLQTHCWSEYQAGQPSSVTIELVNFQQQQHFSFEEWHQQASNIEDRYRQFEQKSAAIQTVLTQPFDLILNTLYHFESLCPLKQGKWYFKIQSNAPIGRGLGSSAAVILSLLSTLIKQHQLTLSDPDLLTLAQAIECRQHGQSSGIDPATLIYAGLLQYQANQTIQPIDTTLLPSPLKAWIIDTGAPSSSTGQCVAQVQLKHANDLALWERFSNTTKQIANAWKGNENLKFKQGIRQNHLLLTQLGVVPEHIQTFIAELETRYDAAAKICGAGSLTGDNAGIVLCLSENRPDALCHEYDYSYQTVSVQRKGLTCD